MTIVRCEYCKGHYLIHTRWPHRFRYISRYCPDCIPVVAPEMPELHTC